MTTQFRSTTGQIESLTEIAAASRWMTSRRSGAKGNMKRKVFDTCVEKAGLAAVWGDLLIYRTVKQISPFFVDRSLRKSDEPDSFLALDELEILAVGWLVLGAEGRWSRMEEFEEVEDGEGKYKSRADRLKGFMDKCLTKGGFQRWDYDLLTDLNYDVWTVVYEADGLEEQPMAASG